MLGLAWGVAADEGFATLYRVVVVEHCALGLLVEVWARAGPGLMMAGARGACGGVGEWRRGAAEGGCGAYGFEARDGVGVVG